MYREPGSRSYRTGMRPAFVAVLVVLIVVLLVVTVPVRPASAAADGHRGAHPAGPVLVPGTVQLTVHLAGSGSAHRNRSAPATSHLAPLLVSVVIDRADRARASSLDHEFLERLD